MACDSKIKQQEETTKNLFKKSLSKKYEDSVDKFFVKVEKKLDETIFKKTPLKHFTIPKEVKDVADMVSAYRMDTIEMAKNAVKISKFLSEELSDADSIALTRSLSGETDIPSHLKKVHDKFRKIIDANAQALVKNGALAEENVIKDYLKNYYKQYIEERSKASFSIKMGEYFKRKDLTHDEKLEIGLIENADFVVANTMLEQRKQLKKAMLLKQIADEFAIDAEKDGYVRISDETVGGGIYKYGALAGKYLPQKIKDELIQAQMISDAHAYLLKSKWTNFIDHVKVNVTVKNPGTHLYNVLSNISLAYMNGDIVPLLKVLKMAVFQRAKFKKLVKMARKFGLNSDLHDYERISANLDTKTDSNLFISFLKNLYMAEGTKMGDGVRKLYSAEDEIFKLASFYKRIEGKKISTKTAKKEFREAMKDYVDYSSPLPKWVRILDRNGIFPFLHYVWKSTPRVAKIIVKNPIKFTLLQATLVATGASIYTEDDNAQKPDWAGDKGFAGLWKYLPSNLFAAKQYVQMEDENFINLGRGLPGMRLGGLQFDGGFIKSFVNLATGSDPRGREYIDKDDSTAVAIAKGVLKTAENFAPSPTFGRYAQRLIKKAIDVDPAKNDFGIEQSWEEIGMRAFGVWRFDREKHVEKKLMEIIKKGAEAGESREQILQKLEVVEEFAKRNNLRVAKKKVDKKITSVKKSKSEIGELYKDLQAQIRVKRGESREEIIKHIKPFLIEAKKNGIELDLKTKKLLSRYVNKYVKYFEK